MRKIWNKGHRIRASDKHLVYHFSIGTLLFVFVAVLLLLNIKQLMRADWEHFSLFEKPYSFLKSQITYALRPKITYAGKAVKLHKQTLNETITAVRSVNYVPDKIY